MVSKERHKPTMTKVKDVLRTINQIENRLHLLEIKAAEQNELLIDISLDGNLICAMERQIRNCTDSAYYNIGKRIKEKACKARDKYDNFIVLDVIKLQLEIKEIKDKLNLKIVEEEVGSE